MGCWNVQHFVKFVLSVAAGSQRCRAYKKELANLSIQVLHINHLRGARCFI